MANVTFKTSREFYNAIATGGDITEAMQDYAKKAIQTMDEKNKARRENQSPNQKANAELGAKFIEFMQAGEIYTAKQIADEFKISTQKAGAILAKTEGIVVSDYSPTGKKKDTVKGYSLAE